MRAVRLPVKSSLAILALVSFALDCKSTDATLQDALTYPGFQTFPSVRTFDGPGTIFRIAKNGTKYPVMTLNVAVVPRGDETIPVMERSGTWALDGALRFAGLGDSAKVTAGRVVSMHAELGPGKRWSTYDTAVDSALATARFNWHSGSTYYLIRETIAVPTLKFSAARGRTSKSVWGAVIGKLVHLGATVSGQDSTTVTLDKAFSPPGYVFYTAETIPRPAAGMFTAPLSRGGLQSTPIRWRAESTTP